MRFGQPRTQFLPARRRLIVHGIIRGAQPPTNVLLPLLEQGVIGDTYMPLPGRFGGTRLEIELKPYDNLTPVGLLHRLAQLLADADPSCRAVLDPWTRSDVPTDADIDLAIGAIGDVLRNYTNNPVSCLRR